MGQQQQQKATGIGRLTREEIDKWDQSDSLKIPDRGETSESRPPAFCGEVLEKVKYNEPEKQK